MTGLGKAASQTTRRRDPDFWPVSTGEPVGHLARFLGALRRIADRRTVDDLA
jgi:hypothetical protein